MKFNGIELVEMIPENWDGKTRKMIVWCNEHTIPEIRTICGYDPIHFGWIAAETLAKWNHCAEIPAESYITNNMTSDEIIEKFKNLRTELKQWLKNNGASNLLVNNLQYGIKTALNLTHANHHFIDVVDFSKIDGNTQANSCKTSRRMTCKELSEWCANGKGLYKNDDANMAYTDFGFNSNEMNEPVGDWIRIRGWHEAEWHEPLIETADD